MKITTTNNNLLPWITVGEHQNKHTKFKILIIATLFLPSKPELISITNIQNLPQPMHKRKIENS